MRTSHDLNGRQTGEKKEMKKGVVSVAAHTQMVIPVMSALTNTPTAIRWYQEAPGVTVRWNPGAVAGLEPAGAVFFPG